VRAKRSLGQNFLVDRNYQRRIVEALDLQPDDEILEIGAGTGALTRLIAGRVKRLVAVELDDGLAAALQHELGHWAGVDVLRADILALELGELTHDPAGLKVVGNIPYNITSPIIFRLLEREHRAGMILLMVQREVADRILAPPGGKAYGALSVGVRSVAVVDRLFHVKRQAFRPVPDVESTMIRILPLRPPPLQAQEENDLRTLTRVAFGWRRKQLQKILRDAPDYRLSRAELERLTEETGIELQRRPETLQPEEFIALSRALRSRSRQD